MLFHTSHFWGMTLKTKTSELRRAVKNSMTYFNLSRLKSAKEKSGEQSPKRKPDNSRCLSAGKGS